MNRPSILTGALWGGLLSVPLMALFFIGQQIARFPFVPFDMFDWLARALPGPVITFGIDTMVDVITTFQLGRLDEAAKTAEQFMALGITFIIGVIAGGLFFFIMNRLPGERQRRDSLPGVIMGAIVGLPFLLFSLAVNLEAAGQPLVSAVWVLGLYMLWGLTVSWLYSALAFRVQPAAAESAAAGEAGTAASVQTLNRRQFMIQVGGATATVTVVGVGLGALLSQGDEATTTARADGAALPPDGLPNANDPLVPAPGTRPEYTPLEDHYRIDIRTTPLEIAEEGYTLPIAHTNAEGDTEILAELTLDQIRNDFESMDAFITMSCISNRIGGPLISTTRWTGVSMQDILDSIDVPPTATHLRINGGDGFDETVALEDIANDRRIMLTHAWDGIPLLPKHGFPLRIHIPDLYGMKQPKWITAMRFLDQDEDGYWVRRGWDKVARVKATSVIDTVAVDMMVIDADENQRIPVGGIAWAGDRGISRVEVRVNDGEWQEAQLRAPISDRTWTIWRYDWPFEEGMHTFEVRCFEADGTEQIAAVASPRPDGASGIHSTRVNL
ncbi:MAG: molybdopterin-dependent oxidoreductase [Chloroflexi bacterium]|nr:molybdopterin-dependent oxidoreductase [Chloroflexota bacterium]